MYMVPSCGASHRPSLAGRGRRGAYRGEWNRRKSSHTTHLHDIFRSATIIRERHPFEGRALPVMSTIKRGGVLLLLIVLPDGSRSLIPASWTNWETDVDDTFASGVTDREPCLASLANLLRVRVLVDALLGRFLIPQPGSAANEESCHATDPGVSRRSPTTTGATRQARCRSTD